MRPTDIARALCTSLLILGTVPAHSQTRPSTFSSVTCIPKTGVAGEKEFCETIAKQMAAFRPQGVAPNRTLSRTAVEFAAWADDGKIALSSVLVKDPIGKNSMKLIFAPRAEIGAASVRTIIGLQQILRAVATAKNVAWIVTVSPEKPGR